MGNKPKSVITSSSPPAATSVSTPAGRRQSSTDNVASMSATVLTSAVCAGTGAAAALSIISHAPAIAFAHVRYGAIGGKSTAPPEGTRVHLERQPTTGGGGGGAQRANGPSQCANDTDGKLGLDHVLHPNPL